MAKHVADVQIHAAEAEEFPEDNDDVDVSVDKIDDRLYLGNLACARDTNATERLRITHILTIDVVPLPRATLDKGKLVFKFVKLADVPKEDLISHFPETNEFIKQALDGGGTVLVHCYFGVSRSAAVVIAYIMEKYGLDYEDAYTLVKSKRRFIGPNVGFVAQLKLFGHMACKLNRDDPRYKQFRLKLAGQKLNQVKILPQLFADLVKPDPGLARERPDPTVYRCRRCRRIVADHSNIIPHVPRELRIRLAKKGIRPPPSKLTGLDCAESGRVLMDKLRSLAGEIDDMLKLTNSDVVLKDDAVLNNDVKGSESTETLEGVELADSSGTLVDAAVVGRDAPAVCKLMWFVEPMAWMQGVARDPHGKLHCPKCQTKIGSFSWVMGCKCPCGQKVAPAFYLVPSKVEWSNIVQNVQITV